MTATDGAAHELAIERLHRLTRWAEDYSAQVQHARFGRIIHSSGAAYIGLTDVEWLLTVARTAQAAAEEGRSPFIPDGVDPGFRADYPATARLVDLFDDEA